MVFIWFVTPHVSQTYRKVKERLQVLKENILIQKGTKVQIGSISCFILGIIEMKEERKTNGEEPTLTVLCKIPEVTENTW